MTKVSDELRAFLSEAGRKGGKAGTGDAKRRDPRSRASYQMAAEARYARERARRLAHNELLEVAREVGGFLDEIHFPTDADDPQRKWAKQRKKLSDRLYAAVAKVKEADG